MKPRRDHEPEAGRTGLPGLRTWPAIYGFVVATFVLWVALLTLLTRMFP